MNFISKGVTAAPGHIQLSLAGLKPLQRACTPMQEATLLAVIQRLVDLWNGWSTRFLVLFSLTLVVLLSLAGVRRHKDRGTLVAILWLAYQLADYTAKYALGNLAASSAVREHRLVAFWAPFLLLHLGGPDNIAAYELEDNKLWKRDILTLVAQAVGAAYVLYKNFSRGDGTFFSLAATFMADVGFVKSLEKTLALRRASLSIIRDSVRTEAPSKCTFFLEYEVPRWGFKGDTAQEEEFFKRHAHALFHVCESAMVDSSVDDDDPNRSPNRSDYGGPARLLRSFTEKATKYRWTLMEMELSLMYDILYTKAAMIHTLPGYCIRVASSLAVAASLLLFRFSGKAGYNRVDVAITYIMLGGALLLEMTSLLSALFSTWTFAFLCTTRSPSACCPLLWKVGPASSCGRFSPPGSLRHRNCWVLQIVKEVAWHHGTVQHVGHVHSFGHRQASFRHMG